MAWASLTYQQLQIQMLCSTCLQCRRHIAQLQQHPMALQLGWICYLLRMMLRNGTAIALGTAQPAPVGVLRRGVQIFVKRNGRIQLQ